MPAEGTEALENLAFDLAREASEFSAQLHLIVQTSLAELVRSTREATASDRCCHRSSSASLDTPIP